MPRIAGADGVYEAANAFRERCLAADMSLLWPNETSWTIPALQELTSAILDYLDKGDRSFMQKLNDQLSGRPPTVQRVAADALCLFYLYDSHTKPTTKVAAVETVASWDPAIRPPDHAFLERSFATGLGGVGTHYEFARPFVVAFFVEFAKRLKEEGADPFDVDACRRIADRLRDERKGTKEARHILLHILFPDQFEGIAADSSKKAIVAAFPDEVGDEQDVDEALKRIRSALAPAYGSSFRFFDEPILQMWSAKVAAPSLKTAFENLLQTYCQARQSAPFSGNHPVYATLQRVTQLLLVTEPVKANPHLKVKFSAGQGNWAKVPWVALMDDRQTTSTQRGLYCVYLFREDCSGVYLTLNQGVTEPREELGAAEGKRVLRERAASARKQVRELADIGFGLDDSIDLRASAGLGSDYEASTIAYKLYEAGNVPEQTQIVADLSAAISAYSQISVDPPVENIALETVHQEFASVLREANVRFGAHHDEMVRSFLTSLLTKPFVILTGLSGSGKTQIAAKFGEWLGQEHCLVVPVRPDWTGPEALFGYEDILRDPDSDGRRAWAVPRVLSFMLKAARDPTNPYLLVLDEMNLAHVERYFADFLSGIESRQPILPNLIQEGGDWRESKDDPNPVEIPRNLFVVGTVNVDETTYMFSPKVLDRANTLEFRVATEDLEKLVRPGLAEPGAPGTLAAMLSVAMDDDWQNQNQQPDAAAFSNHLRSLHAILSTHGAAFGYRSFYEANRFAAIFEALGGAGWLQALDLQVMQKILPRLHGSRRKLEPVLSDVGRFCFDLSGPPVDIDGSVQFDALSAQSSGARLPVSFDKIRRMTRNVRANQFASFAE